MCITPYPLKEEENKKQSGSKVLPLLPEMEVENVKGNTFYNVIYS